MDPSDLEAESERPAPESSASSDSSATAASSSPRSGLDSAVARVARVGPRALLLGVGLVTFGYLALVASAKGPAVVAPGDVEPAIPVSVVGVELTERFEVAERLAGRVISRRRSELGFERNGRLARVLVEEGDRVAAGAPLAELDTRELVAARREQAARLESTRARLDLARVTAQRQRRLSESQYLSPQALDEALSNEASIEAQLAADRAALERTDVAISLSQLAAPYPALIARRHLDEGTVAAPGQTVLSVLEDGVQEVEIGAPPEIASQLEKGGRYTVETRTKRLSAVLRRVLPELDPATRTQTLIFEIEASDESASPVVDGSLVWVRFDRPVEARGAWVPIGALAEGRRGTWTAFAVVDDPDGISRVERRVVEIIQTEELRAFVRGTLRDGDRIVSDGLHRLIPGLAVSPIAHTRES